VTRFSVDSASLRTLAERLENLKSQLNGVAEFGANQSGLGSRDVSGAVANFCSAWRSGIAQVDENIADVADRVTGSADNYDSAESAIVRAYQSGEIE
jgi:hypothetical protein